MTSSLTKLCVTVSYHAKFDTAGCTLLCVCAIFDASRSSCKKEIFVRAISFFLLIHGSNRRCFRCCFLARNIGECMTGVIHRAAKVLNNAVNALNKIAERTCASSRPVTCARHISPVIYIERNESLDAHAGKRARGRLRQKFNNKVIQEGPTMRAEYFLIHEVRGGASQVRWLRVCFLFVVAALRAGYLYNLYFSLFR